MTTSIPADTTKVNYDSAGDDPKLARAEFADLSDKVNQLLAHLRANGFVLGDGSNPPAIGDGLENAGNAIRVKLNGTLLSRGASGLSIANTAVTPGSYTYPNLTINASGQVTAASNGSPPSAGWVPLAELSASGSASLDFTSVISGTYDCYAIVLDKLRPANDQASLQLRVSTDNGSSWKTSAYYFSKMVVETGDSTIQIERGLSSSSISLTKNSGGADSPGNASTDGVSGVIFVWPNGTKHKMVKYDTAHNRNSGPSVGRVAGAGLWTGGTAAVNAVQLLESTGNITDGKARIYAIKNS